MAWAQSWWSNGQLGRCSDTTDTDTFDFGLRFSPNLSASGFIGMIMII